MSRTNVIAFLASVHRLVSRPAVAAGAVLSAVALSWSPPGAAINCSVVNCLSTDQRTIHGYSMFTEADFDPVVDGFGRTRKFWVHIPPAYDTALLNGQEVPLVFAFHGGGQTREAMVAGKWGDHFDDDVAFVIPLGAPDPCDNVAGRGPTQWLIPGIGPSKSPGNVNCDPATQVFDVAGNRLTYWNASLSGSFTDVLFVESLRAMLLARFPQLNPDKVYATGFSSGGGMTFALACYRANLFRGFSVVGKVFAGASARGDYDNDLVVETDANSMLATCGKSRFDAGHATGIPTPRIWGYGIAALPPPLPFPGPPLMVRVAKPFLLINGDQDNDIANIDATSLEIRTRNNLAAFAALLNPFMDFELDDATTTYLNYGNPANVAQPSEVFRQLLVHGIANHSGTHAMPDADECPPVRPFGSSFMTCDWNYTDETRDFWEGVADLNLVP
jgi:poly(3-hydroxybutyrate) depolymerase